jgi:hypothetical protein
VPLEASQQLGRPGGAGGRRAKALASVCAGELDEGDGVAHVLSLGVRCAQDAPEPAEARASIVRMAMDVPRAPRRPPLRRRTLEDLRPLVRDGQYRLGTHAVRHASCEGFTERDVVDAVLFGREMVRYVHDQRLLVLGYVVVSPTVRIPLHVVLEHARPRWVDVVTAFIPAEPHRPISRARLAEILRYDRHEPTVHRGAGR